MSKTSGSATIVKKIISTAACPRPVGPYNQAIVIDRILYLSGVIGLDVESGKLVNGGIVAETQKTLENIIKLLEECDSKLDNVIKCTILLSDISHYAKVNDEYSKVFMRHHPVRTCYAAGSLPLGAAVEIEVIAIVGDVAIETKEVKDDAKL